ncbi:zinc-dependent alcohol dehydrogenase [Neobacillus rhizophilus]|uniref:Alcohol dehydrogenase catalytic domain-containing protein n=1 Tax=Neobacillus rhizophilus TaxID=2833579 RepID=A0A942U1W4_9BACI|nr:alcohol dehydrogenase catalytic domain-containing protein [Neobacillus rhizophilus]MBS4210926.1 alcohol dehydrogenase catalytic domain-containing protein [Neobacillus rhizophilus]
MECVVLKDGQVSLEDTDVPEIGKYEILARVKRAGICGTDLKLYTGNYHRDPKAPPVIIGHEFIGKVVAVGEKVRKVAIGDRIVAHPTYSSCQECKYCARGEFNLCSKRKRIGFDYDGVFAQFVKLHEKQVYIVPDTISDDAGALIEPLSVAVRGVYKADITPTDTVLIIGPGTIGLFTALVAKQFGATVLVCGTQADTERLEIASQMGVDITVMSGDLPNLLKEKKLIIDIVFECSGNENGVNLGLSILRPKGQFVQIGTSSKRTNVSFMDIAYKELKVTGSIAAIKEDWHIAIKLMEKLQTKALFIVKKYLELKDFKEGFEECLNNGGPKVLFTPRET